MIRLQRTNASDKDFQQLVKALDEYLAIQNGDKNEFFAQYNKTEPLKHVVIAFSENIPVACGAIKEYDSTSMEIKRMFVLNELRGKGIAKAVLNELETWAKELGYTRCILETGEQMLDAIALYRKCGYMIIRNYGQYENEESSICFEKIV